AVSMPQSARATFKRQLSPESKVAYMFQCLNRHEQPSSTMIASAVCVNSTFQCLNRHEQPSSRCVGGAEHARASFNASIGTSNLQANGIINFSLRSRCFNASIGTSNLQAPRQGATRPCQSGVSMPQSARATFKPAATVRPTGTRWPVSMPQSARATFKLTPPHRPLLSMWFQCLNRHEQPASLHHHIDHFCRCGFNASSGTSNLQARALPTMRAVGQSFQCLNRHEQPSSSSPFNSRPSGRARFQCLNRHEQPSSVLVPSQPHEDASFNASIGTSNLQAKFPADALLSAQRFQCLNRHEQPSSLIQARLPSRKFKVSMPQSARATFKQRWLARTLWLSLVSMPQSARATFKRSHPISSRRACEVSMPQSARATFKQ